MERKVRNVQGESFRIELQKICTDERDLNKITKDITKCTELDVGDIFQKAAIALNIASMIIPSVQLFQFPVTFCVLSNVFHKLGHTLKSLAKPNEEDKTYSELQRYQDSELRSEAIGFQKALFNNNLYLNEIKEHAAESVINNLEDKISVNETVRFLGKLHAKTQELILTPEVMSACRASTYVNLYFRIAILRTLVLWQVFCIKQRSCYDQSSTKGVLAMINECIHSDLDILSYITEGKLKKALFLTVFNPTEHESFLHFLRIHGYKIPSIGQEKRFHCRQHEIHSYKFPGVILQMSSWYGGRMLGTKTVSPACGFMFEPVDARQLDNVFYLRSTHWPEHYVYMYKDGNCYSVKDTPDQEGQWKLVRLENETDHPPQFLLSTLKWPGRFLYVESTLGIISIKSTFDVLNATDNILWKITDSSM